MGQPQRRVLADVRDLRPEAAAVTDGRHHLVGRVAHDHPDLDDAGRHERLDPVEQDRLVGHRYQLLGAGVGDRSQPPPVSAGEDQALHRVTGAFRSITAVRRYQSPSADDTSIAQDGHRME